MGCVSEQQERKEKKNREAVGGDGEVEGREELPLAISSLIHTITFVIDA